MTTWTKNKYNQYKIITEHGVSQIVQAMDAATARKEFNVIMPGVKISRIQAW